MAAPTVLQSSQSLEMTQTAGDMSQARQRRRRSSRKTDDTQRSNGPNSVHALSSDLNPDLPSSVGPGHVDTVSSDVESSVAPSSISSVVKVQLGDTARKRRLTKLKHPKTPISSEHAGNQSSVVDQGKHSELEDSTAGVASILKKKLHQTELEEKEAGPQVVQSTAQKHTTFRELPPLDDTENVEEMIEHVKLGDFHIRKH